MPSSNLDQAELIYQTITKLYWPSWRDYLLVSEFGSIRFRTSAIIRQTGQRQPSRRCCRLMHDISNGNTSDQLCARTGLSPPIQVRPSCPPTTTSRTPTRKWHEPTPQQQVACSYLTWPTVEARCDCEYTNGSRANAGDALGLNLYETYVDLR